MFSKTILIGLTVNLLFWLNAELPAQAQEGNFSKDVPYQLAIPALIEESAKLITEAGITNEEVLDHYLPLEARLPELLDDMIAAIEEYSQQSLADTQITQFQELADKWDQVVFDYPRIQLLEIILQPVLEELSQELPELRAPRAGDVPLQNLYEFYQAMHRENPWEVGSFFELLPLNRVERLTSVKEQSLEKVKAGIKTITIAKKETTVTENDVVVFYELIINDEVVETFEAEEDITFIHTALKEMRENNENPQLIEAVQQLVELMDCQLALAEEKYDLIVPGPVSCG